MRTITTLQSKRQLDSFQRLKTRLRSNTTTTIDGAITTIDDPSITGLTTEKKQTLKSFVGKDKFYCGLAEGNDTRDCCCYNHYIGLPTKQGKEFPIFDYELDMFDTLENNKLVWVLKSRGLGITEFTLRYMTWKAVTGESSQYRHSQMAIIVGPKLDIAKDLISRIRIMFMNKLGILFETKSDEVILPINNVLVRAYPSNHIDAFRGQPNVSFILVDEGDFFLSKEQKAVRDTIEPYNTKSNAQVVLVSTPNAPDGLMETIELESNDYKKLKLDYTYGLNKIYEPIEIETAKKRGYFEREYNLKYEGLIGNAFSIKNIEAAITDGYSYTDAVSRSEAIPRSCGIDFGGGSSKTAIVITQYVNKKIQVIYARQYERPMLRDITEEVVRLTNKRPGCRIFADASNALAITELKYVVQDYDWRDYNTDKRYINDINQEFDSRLRVMPVNFLHTHRPMLAHLNEILEVGKLQVHTDFKDLQVALRTAYTKGDYDLDKNKSVNDDMLDALRLALVFYRKPQHRAVGNNSPIIVSFRRY